MEAKQGSHWQFLTISGVAVGWIVGLAAVPVISMVLGSILALIVSVTSALVGLSRASPTGEADDPGKPASLKETVSRGTLDPRPIAYFLLGLAIGCSAGVYLRSNDWLSANPQLVVKRWRGPGLDEAEIRRRLFDEMYRPISQTSTPTGEAPVSPSRGTLFAFELSDCDNLRLKHGDALRAELEVLNDKHINAFLEIARDSLSLEALKVLLCGAQP